MSTPAPMRALLLAAILSTLLAACGGDEQAEYLKLLDEIDANNRTLGACTAPPSADCVAAIERAVALSERALPLAVAQCKRIRRPDCAAGEARDRQRLDELRKQRDRVRDLVGGR